MLRWPGLPGGWSTQQQYLLEPVLAAGTRGGAGRAGEGGMQTGSPGCGGAAVAGRGAGVRGHKQVSSALRWDM